MRSADEFTFQNVSQQVIVRLSIAAWLRILSRSAPYVYGAATLLSTVLWFWGTYPINVVSAGALVLAHLSAAAAWVWMRRPSAVAALATWDERAGRSESFVSAYCFEAQDKRTIGEQLHLDRAAAQLSEKITELKRDLPLGIKHHIWISPLVFMAIVSLVLVTPVAPGKVTVNKRDRERAREVAQKLDKRPHLPDEQKSLTEKEKEELKKLDKSVNEAVDNLRKLSGETRREVLAELEKKAHEAETLADALNLSKELLSSEMLAELKRHVDTTDFASALQAKDLEAASRESKEMAERLKNKELSLEERKRIEQAFDKAMSVAGRSDKESMVGKHLDRSLEQMQKKQPEKAANEFSELSKDLREQLQRQTAKNQLQELAQQLRKAGQQIFEQNQPDIKHLAENQSSGMRQLSSQQTKTLREMHLQFQPGGSRQNQMGSQSGSMPGGEQSVSENRQAGESGQGQMGNQFPVPGTERSQSGQGSGRMDGQGRMSMPGSGSGASGSIPVPGTAAGAMPSQGAGVGGLKAGTGTAPLGTAMTIPKDATQTGVVNAQISGEGSSSVRDKTGQMHGEDTERENRNLAEKFIKSEEAALADEPIPLSRREQVLRYFTALRKQLVDSK
jgi:hypothetical protein